jgi:hypothetical protein
LKKGGRPPLFDHVKRAEVCAMVRTGCSIRYAAQNAGVKMASVYYACRTDPEFAAQLRAAEQHRDVGGVRRINTAGEKYWRAAAWILERAAPKHFSLRGAKKKDRVKQLDKQELRHFVTNIVHEVLIECIETSEKEARAAPGLDAIEERLAEITAERERLMETADEEDELDEDVEEGCDEEEVDVLDDDDVEDGDDDQGEVYEGEDEEAFEDDEAEDESAEDEVDDEESAAQASYQRLVGLLRRHRR